ncbi:XRE family transcriptional regulator [Mesorhizobium sp. M0915]|uniref:XRE family transcriptional regulator n=1 Tax=Mesorhizobium sp. M0915 TaxID=2957027 RepID=UPI0033373EB1
MNREGKSDTVNLRGSSKAARDELRSALTSTVARRELSQTDAAKLCRTDQPTMSKVMAGRVDSISIDQLARWLTALGCTVEIHLYGPVVDQDGALRVVIHE